MFLLNMVIFAIFLLFYFLEFTSLQSDVIWSRCR